MVLLKSFRDVIDLSIVDATGENAFHRVVRRDLIDVMQVMFNMNDSLLNVGNMFGNTPLHHAALNNKRSVEWLLNNGADANIQNNRNETPDEVTDDQDIEQLIRKYQNK